VREKESQGRCSAGKSLIYVSSPSTHKFECLTICEIYGSFLGVFRSLCGLAGVEVDTFVDAIFP
jgi:hypothetical protein